ncbi:MAG TPA: hypothetical protein VG247_07960 [Pseudonocardiaceae bacterium]|jgi:hypothetical protein|nr:hypothetical protein [Pseudonocardiaceae bacterium]
MASPVPGQDSKPSDTEPRHSPGEPSGQPSNRARIIVTIVAAAVVLIGAAASVWWFSGRAPQPNQHAAPPPVSTPRHTSKPKPTPDSSAYGVGTCLDEPVDPNSGGLELTPVPCSGTSAVLMVDQVVTNYNDCQQGADYVNHGFILSDEVANVDYCVSLVVPANQCFAFSTDNSKPIQRAACGSAANVVRVESVEPAASVTAACKDQTAPDIWYFQSPTSGQYACVTSLPPGASSTDSPATSATPTL